MKELYSYYCRRTSRELFSQLRVAILLTCEIGSPVYTADSDGLPVECWVNRWQTSYLLDCFVRCWVLLCCLRCWLWDLNCIFVVTDFFNHSVYFVTSYLLTVGQILLRYFVGLLIVNWLQLNTRLFGLVINISLFVQKLNQWPFVCTNHL